MTSYPRTWILSIFNFIITYFKEVFIQDAVNTLWSCSTYPLFFSSISCHCPFKKSSFGMGIKILRKLMDVLISLFSSMLSWHSPVAKLNFLSPASTFKIVNTVYQIWYLFPPKTPGSEPLSPHLFIADSLCTQSHVLYTDTQWGHEFYICWGLCGEVRTLRKIHRVTADRECWI